MNLLKRKKKIFFQSIIKILLSIGRWQRVPCASLPPLSEAGGLVLSLTATHVYLFAGVNNDTGTIDSTTHTRLNRIIIVLN